MTIDELLHAPFVDAGHRGQQADRAIEIGRVQPHDRYVEPGTVLDQDRPSRSNNTPRGARSGSSRWWLFSAISWNFSCWMIWKNQKLPASSTNHHDRHLQDRDAGGLDFAGFAGAHGVSSVQAARRAHAAAAAALLAPLGGAGQQLDGLEHDDADQRVGDALAEHACPTGSRSGAG